MLIFGKCLMRKAEIIFLYFFLKDNIVFLYFIDIDIEAERGRIENFKFCELNSIFTRRKNKPNQQHLSQNKTSSLE